MTNPESSIKLLKLLKVNAFTCDELVSWQNPIYDDNHMESVKKCNPSDLDECIYDELSEKVREALIQKILDCATSISDMKDCTMSGRIFNRFVEKFDVKLVKLTNKSEIHNGVQFVTGPNEDPLVFDTRENCSPGGIYLTDSENQAHWIGALGDIFWARPAKIPDDAQVHIEPDNKIKVSKVILGERTKV